MYSKENGYVRAHQWKCPKTSKNSKDDMLNYVMQCKTPRKNQEGDTRQVMQVWRKWYRHKGLTKYGAFSNSGDFNTP